MLSVIDRSLDRDRTEWFRLEQEERYRQELTRRQILQRQWDMAQTVQPFPFVYQDSMWGQQQTYTRSNSSFAPSLVRRTTSSPVISTSHGVGSTWPQQSSKFGSALIVRNPSAMSRTDISKPLSVDVSVEYELPEFLKVSTKTSGPSLLMIRNKSAKKQCSVTGCTKCGTESKQKQATAVNRGVPHGVSRGVSGTAAWRVSTDLSEGVAGDPKENNHSYILSSFNTKQNDLRKLHQSQSAYLENLPKTTTKRKISNNEEFVSKRQKVTSLTPQDIMSASFFLETSRNMIQAPTESIATIFQRSPTMYQRSPPTFQKSPLMFQKSPTNFQTSLQMFQRSPVFQEQLYPVSCSMYPQYRHNATCTGCSQGICQTMR